MVASSSSIVANSVSVLNSSVTTGKETSSFLSTNRAPKSTNDLVQQSISSNRAGVVNQSRNVAVPSDANLVGPSDITAAAALAVSLNSTTSVDQLIEKSNDAVASETSQVTSRALNNTKVESLKEVAPQSSGEAVVVESTGNTTSAESITNTSSAEKTTIAAANQAYTTTASYGQSGSGGSGTFSLSL